MEIHCRLETTTFFKVILLCFAGKCQSITKLAKLHKWKRNWRGGEEKSGLYIQWPRFLFCESGSYNSLQYWLSTEWKSWYLNYSGFLCLTCSELITSSCQEDTEKSGALFSVSHCNLLPSLLAFKNSSILMSIDTRGKKPSLDKIRFWSDGNHPQKITSFGWQTKIKWIETSLYHHTLSINLYGSELSQCLTEVFPSLEVDYFPSWSTGEEQSAKPRKMNRVKEKTKSTVNTE